MTADTIIRNAHGKIHARPAAGEPVWNINGRLLPQSAALTYADELLSRAQAELAEKHAPPYAEKVIDARPTRRK